LINIFTNKDNFFIEISKSKPYESYKHGIMISDFRENCIKTFLLFPCIFEKQHILLLLKQPFSHSDGVVSLASPCWGCPFCGWACGHN
jgi:hypothetical protein